MKLVHVAGLLIALFFGTSPASTNYTLQSYGFGGGGTANSASSNYRVNGLSSEVAGSSSSTHYKAGAGFNPTLNANVPTLTLGNTSNWYDKLTVVLNPQNNASDATFAIEISTDNFVTTEYVKNDFTIETSITSADYLTYTGWGGASGVVLRGLVPSTTYYVRAAAMHGAFTESQFGPVASASTVNEQLTFRLDVAPTYTSSSPPYDVSLPMVPGSIVTASDKIWTTISTNADNGAYIYGDGLNGALFSQTTGHTILSTNVDLSTVGEGFGEQDVSASQTSGGPMAKSATYNISGTNVGEDYPDLAEMFTSSGAPVTSGVGGISLLGKTSTLTPYAQDYSDTLTFVAAGSF